MFYYDYNNDYQNKEEENMKREIIDFDEFIVKFRSLVKSLGLNNSTQREYVLKVLFECDNHLSAEEIALHVKQKYKLNIGIATVYRIINLLEEMKIINGILIDGKDSKVYELNIVSHHDHIVCTKCGKIVEFFDAELEKIQELVANEKGFNLESHNMILYGICQECR